MVKNEQLITCNSLSLSESLIFAFLVFCTPDCNLRTSNITSIESECLVITQNRIQREKDTDY